MTDRQTGWSHNLHLAVRNKRRRNFYSNVVALGQHWAVNSTQLNSTFICQ